ncbi:MAG: hypothetical protein RBU30_20550 [Polyangia bacterium]|jgi:hypothetical protein|nr:hypothetical protein [Polyangia bacterium]
MTEAARAPKSLPSATAGVLIGVLGINVWTMLILVPTLYGLSSTSDGPTLGFWLLFAPLPVLAWGGFRRSRVTLLALYPICLALVSATMRGPGGQGIFTAWTFGLAALSLIGYLLGSTILLEVQARRDDAVAKRAMNLPPLSGKWRRRRRVYAVLAAFAALIPLSFIYTVDFHGATSQLLLREYGPGAGEMQILFVVCSVGLWLWLFHSLWMVPLEAHRRGDGDVRHELQALHRRSRQHPGASFYVMVFLALAFMGLLLWMRWRYG